MRRSSLATPTVGHGSLAIWCSSPASFSASPDCSCWPARCVLRLLTWLHSPGRERSRPPPTWALVQAVDGVALSRRSTPGSTQRPPTRRLALATQKRCCGRVGGCRASSTPCSGLTLVLLGVVVTISRRFGAWLGWVAVAAGSLSLAIGIDIAYRGSETEFDELSSVAYQLLVRVFVVGILVAELRPGATQTRRSASSARTWSSGDRPGERPPPLGDYEPSEINLQYERTIR